jgi:tetratricopeptide (TPR) repeat protein
VLDTSIAKLGADHPNTLLSKHNLAVLYKAWGRKYDRAEALFREVLGTSTAKRGADHPFTLITMHSLAVLYQLQEKLDQAEPLFAEVLRVRTAKLGADHPEILQSMNNLAMLYLDQRKYDQAEKLLGRAEKEARQKLSIAHPDTQKYVHNLAECHEQMGQLTQAECLRRELADLSEQRDGNRSLQYASRLSFLGLNLLRQQKFADAEPPLRACLDILENKQPEEWNTFNVKSLLGGSLLGQRQYPEAEPLLVQGYEGLKQRQARIPPTRRVFLTEALERLVQLYDALEKKDKADELRKKLEETKVAAKPPARP